MKAYRHLVKFALAAGHTVSVHDGEDWPVKRGARLGAIVAAVESVDVAQLLFRDATGERAGSATVSAFGLADDETVIDWTCSELLMAWETEYEYHMDSAH